MAIVADAGLRSHPNPRERGARPSAAGFGRSSAFARVRRPAHSGAGRRGRTLPLRRGARRRTLNRVVRRRCTLPSRGGAEPVTLWWADRHGCTLPYGRRGAGRAVVGGSAQVHAPLREARRRSRCGGRTDAGARSLAGGARRYTLNRMVRRRCTLPSRGGAEPVTLWWADRHGCTLPYGRRGAGRAVVGGPARVHAPLREARRGSRCGGRTGAGARSLTGGARRSGFGGPTDVGARSLAGGAEHRLPIAARDRTYVRTLTINPLDKACQGSSAREIGCGPGAGASDRLYGREGAHEGRPYGRRPLRDRGD